ncbi:type VII secretion target [Kibdelosporangium aridum]|uniref:Excreted virulence factor EspC, type VII ESX diderm n=1 Tax=Kibdelosporangium aridum TaxID=2030 RepID=A0A1W2DSS6_KIBAR|nr:type VII secretion target [Kibdelosporangium aridum]SMD00463.1 Excreted virulence factor EspC, type VII ESX diderm [Kibdelosporangium aridum]
MPDQSFAVVDDELRAFAKALRDTADKVNSSANVVRGVSYNVTTWGIVGQLFSIGARKATGDASAALEKGANSIRDAATGVDNSAQAYADNDTFLANNNFGGNQ